MIVGRTKEIALLEKIYESNKSAFVALYGRRRIGKTYLVRTLFKNRITLQLTGLSNASLEEQLVNFNTALKNQKYASKKDTTLNWLDAFQKIRFIIEKSKRKKKVIFIDELPWFDTTQSGFISALEHFWNDWAAYRKDILLVVCGSAASWMINNLINNKGGLHNRVTQKIKLEPFTLKECQEFLNYKKITLDHYQIIQLYMVLGGVPFYWDATEKGQSSAQLIQKICFSSNGLLTNEFDNLFKSLFNKAERHEAIVKALAKKNKGLTRDEIVIETNLTNGGGFTRLLEELEESGFIRKYIPFGKKYRNSLYQLSDFFSLFHLKFMNNRKLMDKNYWLKMIDNPKHRAWSGYAFEQVCLAHIPEIKKGLGISGVETETSSWKSSSGKNVAQVDLVIDRRDGIVNLCEMKFSINQFSIDKKYDFILRNKQGIFKTETKTRKSVFTTLITTFGLKSNAYSGNVQNELTMTDLF